MGKGQRHSKNAGVMGSETLSYAERKALGYGTVRERLGKDSQANFYDCALTLQPAVDPMVTPDGVVYSKEAILENLLAQKKAIKRKVRASKRRSVAAATCYAFGSARTALLCSAAPYPKAAAACRLTTFRRCVLPACLPARQPCLTALQSAVRLTFYLWVSCSQQVYATLICTAWLPCMPGSCLTYR